VTIEGYFQVSFAMYAAEEIDLNDMLYAEGARFDPEKVCLPHTRDNIIDEINEWINSPNSDDVPRIFYLSGVAGSGKSTIAHTIAHRYEQLGRLGSSFCFDRADQANRRPDNIFSTIARDLADLDPQRKRVLWLTVKDKRSLRSTRAPREQFDKFILIPAKNMNTIGPVVIVIDGLDECGDEGSRKVILYILAEAVMHLPSNFRILITARPETDIEKALASKHHVFCKRMDTIDAKSTSDDILLYVQAQLSDIEGLERRWPNRSWCLPLVERSEGLFQWAFTACRFITGDGKSGLDPVEQLDILLSPAPSRNNLSTLDQLYFDILARTFPSDNATFMDRFRLILGRVLAAHEALSISSLMELGCEDDYVDVTLVIHPLGSLLSGVARQNVAVRPLHTSFRDFLTDATRSKQFFIDVSLHHSRLTLACMRVMRRELRFNICNLKTSHVRNTDVHDLTERVVEAISPHLSYSCRFWADHLLATAYEDIVFEAVRCFLDNLFLYWLEVLSVIRRVNMASRMLSLVVMWIEVMSIVKTSTEAKLTKYCVDPQPRTFNGKGCEQIRDGLCEHYI
jgi:AAA ATPase domain